MPTSTLFQGLAGAKGHIGDAAAKTLGSQGPSLVVIQSHFRGWKVSTWKCGTEIMSDQCHSVADLGGGGGGGGVGESEPPLSSGVYI